MELVTQPDVLLHTLENKESNGSNLIVVPGNEMVPTEKPTDDAYDFESRKASFFIGDFRDTRVCIAIRTLLQLCLYFYVLYGQRPAVLIFAALRDGSS